MNTFNEASEHVAGGVRNTPRMNSSEPDGSFTLLGHGFDTVEFSLITRVPEALAEEIAEAQRKAKASRRPEPATLGPGKVSGEVLRHGGGGGDAIFSTCELGEFWFFKLDQKKDAWGVTVKIRALNLLCHGFEVALETAWRRATGLGLKIAGYSLGRIDYRFDIRTPHTFAPIENRMIRPNRMLVQPYETYNRRHPNYDWNDGEMRHLLRGAKIETLMVGKIGSGNQLVFYNKRSEQAAKRESALFESYGLNSADKCWGLWRIEVRFRGDVLKRRWNVRRIDALQNSLQAMLRKALTRVCYTDEDVPQTADGHALHPIWAAVIDTIPLATCAQPSQFAPERAEYLIQKERERSLKASITGCATSLAAMQSHNPDIVAKLAPDLAKEVVTSAIISDPGKPAEAIRRSIRS